MKRIIGIVALCILLTGCTTKQFNAVTDWYKSSESELRLAVHTTTNVLVRTSDRAATITKVVKSIQSKIADGTLVNASMVQDYINSYLVSSGVTAGDIIVINDLLPEIKKSIIKVFESEQLTNAKDQLVEINKVLGWILDITTLIK
jgi:hypothetical protein